MKTHLIPICIVISILALASCVEEYWPELNGDYTNQLVIDGKITNEPGPYTIKLSNTSSLNEPAYNPLSGAIVIISDNEGNSETLTETSAGIYQTSPTGIQGIIGRMYKLSLSIAGKNYETAFEELLAPVPIESFNYEIETQLTNVTEKYYEEGYQFYVTSDKATNNETYYYWEVEETYENHASYPLEFTFSGTINVPINKDSLYYCWTTEVTNNIYTKSTKNLHQAKVLNLPLHFMPLSNEKTRIGYSAIAKQFTISSNAYFFLSAIEDMNSNNDGLYSSQPYQITGNLVNIENPEEAVLGYFLTAGVSKSEHVFTPRGFFTDVEQDVWSRTHCHVRSSGYLNLPTNYEYMVNSTPDQWPLYFAKAWILHVTLHRSFYTLELVGVEDVCADCRTKGGTTQKPDFWVD